MVTLLSTSSILKCWSISSIARLKIHENDEGARGILDTGVSCRSYGQLLQATEADLLLEERN